MGEMYNVQMLLQGIFVSVFIFLPSLKSHLYRIAERKGDMPADCNYPSYSSSSCQKEIKLQIHLASSSKCFRFLLLVDRKVVSLEWKQTKNLTLAEICLVVKNI